MARGRSLMNPVELPPWRAWAGQTETTGRGEDRRTGGHREGLPTVTQFRIAPSKTNLCPLTIAFSNDSLLTEPQTQTSTLEL